jgi:hypothetical protein
LRSSSYLGEVTRRLPASRYVFLRTVGRHAPCDLARFACVKISRAFRSDRPDQATESALLLRNTGNSGFSDTSACTTLGQQALSLGSAGPGNCVCDFRRRPSRARYLRSETNPILWAFLRQDDSRPVSPVVSSRCSLFCALRERSKRSTVSLTCISPPSPSGNSPVPAGVSEPGVTVYSLCLREVL